MAVFEPGTMFGFGSMLCNGSVSEATVVVSGAAAVLLKLPPPPPGAPGKEVASELLELAAALAEQETRDIAEFWARERARPVSSMANKSCAHFRVRLRERAAASPIEQFFRMHKAPH